MLKIIFMSNGIFGIPALKYLISKKKIKVSYIITSKKKYINNKINLVKKISKENKINIIYSEDIDKEKYIKKIKKSNPDFQIVISFKILKEKIWKIPKYGTINIHPSLLPQYKGACPINWTIINGDKITGLTSFFINNEIDSGKIILQKRLILKKEYNYQNLFKKLSILSKYFLMKTILKVLYYRKKNKSIEYKKKYIKDIKPAPKINNYYSKIYFFLYSEKKIYRLTLGLPLNKPAWCFLSTKGNIYLFSIFKINIEYDINLDKYKNLKIGEILYINKRVFVRTKNNFIELLFGQLNNRTKNNVVSIFNGLKDKKYIFLF